MENSKKNAIRESIIASRNARGWTQADLAEHIDMKLSTYARKEVQSDFKANELLVIAEALNVDVKDFFGNDTSPTSTIKMLNEQQKTLDVEPEIIPTRKERDVILLMRSSKQNKDVFLNIMGILNQKSIDDEKLNKIIEILNED